MGTVKTLLTFEAFEQLPDQPGKQELVRGELIEMPPRNTNITTSPIESAMV